MAVVLREPERLQLDRLALLAPGAADVVVEVAFSGISSGTERLLWSGRMPPFPGMGYPLVPGYETVGRVVEAGDDADLALGQAVFVPGANCFEGARGLFGGAASHLVVPAARVMPIASAADERAILLALAATAHHALRDGTPDLIVGHGVLGRLCARLACLAGGEPIVWERDPARRTAAGYAVVRPEDDARRDYRRICDVSGDAGVIDTLVSRLAAGGEIVLAGFYSERLSFAFPPAFMREARLRIAAQWQKADLEHVARLVADGALSLDGLISHVAPARDAVSAYEKAFTDPECLKMVLDWRNS